VTEFLARGDVAVVVETETKQERDLLTISTSRYLKRSDLDIWISRIAPTELLLVDLTRAPEEVTVRLRARR
jgi:hypothetical protein